MKNNLEISRRKLYLPQEITEPIALPSSKSISNRLLILKYVVGSDNIRIDNLSTADDSLLMQDSLMKIKKYLDNADFKFPLELNLKNSGTAYRFLTAYLSILNADFILNCDERMKLRPIKPLVDSLMESGCSIQYIENEGFPPIKISASKISKGQNFTIDISASSQFASAILLISPFFDEGFSIEINGGLYSKAYIDMSLKLMTDLGLRINKKENIISVDKLDSTKLKRFKVEADWSSAAFLFQFIACSEIGTSVFINDLRMDSIQGDKVLIDVFENFGVKSDFNINGLKLIKYRNSNQNLNVDFTNTPDIAIPVICAAAKLGVIAKFTGLKNLIHKESNRIEALEINLAKFNYDFRQVSDDEAVLINSCKPKLKKGYQNQKIEIDVFNDHRLFMAFALMADECTDIILDNEDAYKKSFPNFLKELTKLGFEVKT